MPLPLVALRCCRRRVRHQEVVPTVDADAASTLDLSSRYYEIRSGQTRSGHLRLHLAFPSFSDVASVYNSSVSYACCKCFHVDVVKIDWDVTIGRFSLSEIKIYRTSWIKRISKIYREYRTKFKKK
jgi:hypothetical protein